MPKIAVLLAAYNGAQWLDVQLNSIVAQKNIDWTLFIAVDESTDSTIDVCKKIMQFHPSIVLLPSVGRLGDAASNFFRLIKDVDLAIFDYVAFSDQDDIWNGNKISTAIEKLSFTNSDAYSSNVTAFWPDGRTCLISKAQVQVEWDYLFESAGPGCTFLLNQPLALKLQAFVRNNSVKMQSVWMHDWFIYAFARAQGYKWTIDPQSNMHYRQHANNQVGVNSGLKAFKYRALFVLSGKALAQSALIATLVGKGDASFVKSWYPFSRLGFFKLALQANKCRRKFSERVLFFCACLLLSIVGTGITADSVYPSPQGG